VRDRAREDGGVALVLPERGLAEVGEQRVERDEQDREERRRSAQPL
jgi:hypothetical protein